jgi:starch synthase
VLARIGLPSVAFAIDGVEFHGDVSTMKAGLFYADRLTTVSPGYAREIQTVALGEGFHGLLAARAPDLVGIVNGVDIEVWDPRTDAHLSRHYGDDDLEQGKRESKRALQDELGLTTDGDGPLFGLVGRLTAQKGIDLVLGALPSLREAGAQLAVLGSGEPALEQALQAASAKHRGAVAYRWGYDEPLSHRIIAGSDMLLVPSRFEPCGLTQMYAMRYGTPPVVRRTGGLADTVLDADASALGNGFTFEPPNAVALAGAIDRAIAAWTRRERWRAIQRRGMATDHGWDRPATRYRAVYRDALGGA